MKQLIFNNKTKKYLTGELLSKVLGKKVVHEKNNGILLDCGELHYFNLDTNQGEHESMSVFLNKVQAYANKLKYEICVFGSANSEEINDNIYTARIKQNFNDIIYLTKESTDRAETILECIAEILKLEKQN